MTNKNQQASEGEVSELTIVPTKENASVEIVPFGTTDRIRLSAAIVRQMIAVPTRTKKMPDDNQCIKFIMLCKARHLNPFEGDAYMIGYDTQDGAQFSLITAHQVFLKRAEASKGFNGMESGVIVEVPLEGSGHGILEREGDLVYDKEKLLGGWAKVYRKDREKPFYRRLKLATFNTGRSRWEKDPAGMICKCAEADALRTAFPTLLGGLYIEEEAPPINLDAKPKIARAKVPKDLPVPSDMPSSESPTEPAPDNTGRETGSSPSGPGEARESTRAEPTPAAGKPLTRKKKAAIPSTEERPYGDREMEMIKFLSANGYLPSDLMQVALANEWVTADETWPLPEEKLARFLTDEAKGIVLEELESLKK